MKPLMPPPARAPLQCFADQSTQHVRNGLLVFVVGNQVVAHLNHHVEQTVAQCMFLQRMGDAVCRAIRVVLGSQHVSQAGRAREHLIGKPFIAVAQDAQLHIAADAVEHAGKGMDGDQNGGPPGPCC
jgi:K+-transporting ATPase c subunit